MTKYENWVLTSFFGKCLPVENSVECVENLENQGQILAKEFFACGKLFLKACQVFFENFSFSTICTNRQLSTRKIRFLPSADRP